MLEFKVESDRRIVSQREGEGVNTMILQSVMISTFHHHLSSLSQQLSWQVLISLSQVFPPVRGLPAAIRSSGQLYNQRPPLLRHLRTFHFVFTLHLTLHRDSLVTGEGQEGVVIHQEENNMSGRRQGQTVAKHHTSVRVIKSDRFQLERFRAI